MDEASVRLFDRYRNGDEDAADELFRRYVDRLIGLARNRMSSGLARRVDAEDVVQSVYRSFFAHARNGQYAIERAGDLWRLLATITVNKVRKKARFHGQQKRSIDRERSLDSGTGTSADEVELFAGGPATPDAVAVVDELEAVMVGLEAKHREMLELRLQGQCLQEIADKVGRSQRTVRRFLDQAQTLLEQRLLEVRD